MSIALAGGAKCPRLDETMPLCYNIIMDIQQLKYFLAVAREGSVSRAAAYLYITQPSLTRQMQNLEKETGRQLFVRGGRRMRLTESGELLFKRAEEIVELFDKTEKELIRPYGEIGGEIFIGGGETRAMKIITDLAAFVREKYPAIRFHLHSGDMADVCERLDKGLADFGLIIEPAELDKYEYVRLPVDDVWGVMMRRDDPLAAKDCVTREDLAGVPLLRSRHSRDRSAVSKWIRGIPDAKIAATYNLLYNASLMTESGIGKAVCIDGIVNTEGSGLCFKPLYPAVVSGIYVAWKKNQVFSKAASIFLRELLSRYSVLNEVGQ